MEKSSQSSFLKSLALAFGDGLLFGVAMKLAQGPSKTREDEMTDLGPLAERLRRVEDHTQIDKDALVKFGEGQDGRVLEKVIVALEARLTEHVGQVDRRLAEIDAQVALDLKAVDTHTAAQTNAVEKAIQQIEAQVRDYVAAAQQSSAEPVRRASNATITFSSTRPSSPSPNFTRASLSICVWSSTLLSLSARGPRSVISSSRVLEGPCASFIATPNKRPSPNASARLLRNED